MPFSFKVDNTPMKIGLYIIVPIVAILTAYSIYAQACGGSTDAHLSISVPSSSPPAASQPE